MLTKRFLLICTLPSLIVGCAGFDTQPPAPVYQGGSPVYTRYPSAAPKVEPVIIEKPVDIVETKPLEDRKTPITAPIEMLPEPLTPDQETPLEEEPSAAELTLPELPPAEIVKPAPPPEPASPPFTPLESFAPMSPVVGSLVVSANKNTQSGDIESATTTIERAIRIEPRNATLYYKLAVLRLNQSKPRLAEDLAKKSALLATNDNQLKKHSWLLIAKAREMQKNFDGAKEARAKASKF
ncbi:MAG: tetratricopeptide repeat protein [Methylococcaceae bacterium]